MERPTGVTILAALSIISGIIAILGGLALFTVGPGLIGGVVLILGILSLIYGWGLWTLKPWAWMLAIIGAALNLATALISALSGQGLGSYLLTIVINIVILWYLFQPTVKRAFGR